MDDNVMFEDEQNRGEYYQKTEEANKRSFVTSLVFKLHFAKTERGAKIVLLVIAIVALALSVYILYGTFGNSASAQVPQLPIQVQNFINAQKQ